MPDILTEDGEEYLVDALQAIEPGTPDWHDSGTGTTAPVKADTALETPTGEARDQGTKTEGGSTQIYRSVVTHTYAGTFAVTEHGLFSASAAGVMITRSTFAAINVVSSDKIEFTLDLEMT